MEKRAKSLALRSCDILAVGEKATLAKETEKASVVEMQDIRKGQCSSPGGHGVSRAGVPGGRERPCCPATRDCCRRRGSHSSGRGGRLAEWPDGKEGVGTVLTKLRDLGQGTWPS